MPIFDTKALGLDDLGPLVRTARPSAVMDRRPRRDSDECPDDFKCSITLEVMRDPVLLVSSGITYERSSLVEALERRPNVDPNVDLV